MSDMNVTEITEYCLLKNGAYQEFPFGYIPICFKVCNRFINEQPVGCDMAFSIPCIVTCQGMVEILQRKGLFFAEKLKHFFKQLNIVPSFHNRFEVLPELA